MDIVAPAGPPRSPASLHSPAGKPHRVAAFAFLMIVQFLYGWAWNTVDVLRPAFRDSLHLTLTQVGSGYSAQGGGAVIGAVVIGQLADRLGRRTMLVIVLLGIGTTLVAGVAVASYLQFLLQRVTLGMFMGGIFPITVGIFVDLFTAQVRGRLASFIDSMFSAAAILLGLLIGALAAQDWRLVLWLGGIPTIVAACLVFVVIPHPGRLFQVAKTETGAAASKFPILELFASGVRSQTIRLVLMIGLNFFAYQAFSGWLTIYLTDERSIGAAAIGFLLASLFTANLLGCFFWGWLADRFGRRMNAAGLLTAGLCAAVFLAVPGGPWILVPIATVYGFALSSSVIWGPWLAELYPAHLRSTASSIYHWGRIISFFAPLVTGTLAGSFGLTTVMLLGSFCFFAASAIWVSLPETLSRNVAARHDKRVTKI